MAKDKSEDLSAVDDAIATVARWERLVGRLEAATEQLERAAMRLEKSTDPDSKGDHGER